MFSKSAFSVLKQKALQGLQQNLEQVGIHSGALESTVLKSDDPHIAHLSANIPIIEDALKGIKKGASQFFASTKALNDSNATVANAVKSMCQEEDAMFVDGVVLSKVLDSGILGQEIKSLVLDPIDSHLALLQDLKTRLKQRGILQLEVRHLGDVVAGLITKGPPAASKLSVAEDKLAEKQLLFNQITANLYEELEQLKRDKYKMVHNLALSFKMCQHRYLASSAGNLQDICVETELPVDKDPEPERIDSPPVVVSAADVETKAIEEDDIVASDTTAEKKPADGDSETAENGQDGKTADGDDKPSVDASAEGFEDLDLQPGTPKDSAAQQEDQDEEDITATDI